MNALDRVASMLERARVSGGWIDEDIAADVLKELDLDENGVPLPKGLSDAQLEVTTSG